MQPYPLAHGCDSALNLWCDHNCPHFATHGRLLARYDTSAQGHSNAWRCYAASTLTADGARYARGETYCTRHVQLGEVLAACRRDSAAYDSEAEEPAAAAASAPCEDAVAECHLWAQYGECDANPRYMRESCRKSCRACGGAGTPPPPPKTPPTPTPTPTPASPPPPSVVCESPCARGGGGACSGRGRCVEWAGHEFCMCAHDNAARARRLGLSCEREVAPAAACDGGCSGRGACVNGWCECEFGRSGRNCEVDAPPPPAFLDRRALREAGVVGAKEGSCVAASWGAAYARNATRMRRLLASLPDDAAPLRCETCALVSNAGVLARREYGAAIDANECVWRMNRAPTKGFEGRVGSKTTLDYVNSFPHIRGIGILPRLDTTLLHGMTVELMAREGLFERYMAWVDGHVSFTEQHPQHAAYVLGLDFMVASWDAYWAYLAPHEAPATSQARPSSGWHMARLALASCAKVNMYGFSLEADDFHYFDSLVQERVRPAERDPGYGVTHKFAREHEVFRRWAEEMPERVEIFS